MNIEKNYSELQEQITFTIANKKRHCQHYTYSVSLKPKVKSAFDDLEKNHDYSLAVELFLQNKNNLDKKALLYRGHEITYKELFANSFAFAKSLKSMGYGIGSEIPVIISNSPEYIYMYLAISLIGAKMNTMGTWFHPNYITEIVTNSNSPYFFISDDIYQNIQPALKNLTNLKGLVTFSLTDSLRVDKNNNPINPYQSIDDKFHPIINKLNQIKNTSPISIFDKETFLNIGSKYQDKLVADMTLDDVSAITYTSGTTRPGYPKGCIHSNRNYITISRFKRPDVSGMPAMKDLVVMAHLPSYTQTILTTAYTDPLYLGCTVALEPFFDEKSFPYALIINKPNYVVETPGYFLQLAKLLNEDPQWKNIKMPYLMLPTVVGEPLAPGEEKYLNYTSRQHKFGTGLLPYPLAPITFSLGGGSSENCGIFVTLFRSLQDKRLSAVLKKEHVTLLPLPFADVEVLNKDGYPCQVGETGQLVANSPCNMIGYTKEEFNNELYFKDASGKVWFNGMAYAIKNKLNNIRIVGRPSSNILTQDGSSTPIYKIEDAIQKDTKQILSAVLVKVNDNNENYYVCHIETQPHLKTSNEELLKECAERLKDINPEILDKLFFRVRTLEESFPLAPSGKRDVAFLINEGVSSQCLSYNSIMNLEKAFILKKIK